MMTVDTSRIAHQEHKATALLERFRAEQAAVRPTIAITNWRRHLAVIIDYRAPEVS
jgi:hypothetical protein